MKRAEPVNDILQLNPKGLYCSEGDFYIDPWQPVNKTVITHAHADHARWGCRSYLCATKGKGVLQARLGSDASIETLDYGKVKTVNGIPIPGGTTAADIGRLSSLVERLQPDELLVLGDLMHGRIDGGRNFSATVDTWRRRWAGILLTMVTGNHDLRAGPPPTPFRLDRIVAQHVCGPFVFSHKAQTTYSRSRYTIAGHVHPAVFVSGKGHQRETLPCFCFGEKRGGAAAGLRKLHRQSGNPTRTE